MFILSLLFGEKNDRPASLPKKMLKLRPEARTSFFFLACFFILGIKPVSAQPVLYIPNNSANTLSAIDGNTLKLGKSVTVGREPYGVTVSPGGRTVLVTNLADDTLSVIDTNTDKVLRTIGVGDAPFGVVTSPDGRLAYVANAGNNNVSIVDIGSGSVVSAVSVGACPHGLALVPDGSLLYVTNYCSENVSVINTASRQVVKNIPVGPGPHGICVHPAGSYVYVANVFSDSISVISTSSRSVVNTISTGKQPFFPAVDSSGKFLYVSNFGDKSVTVIDTSTQHAVGLVTVGNAPHGIDISGSYIYVANEGSSTVSVIDASTRSVITTLSDVSRPVAFGDFVVDSFPALPAPAGNQGITYTAVSSSSADKDPARSKPFSVGIVAEGGDILSARVEFDKFLDPVDIYVALYAPALTPEILLMTPDLSLQPLSAGYVAWRRNTLGPVNSSLFGDIPMAVLPPVKFTFGILVTPVGRMDSSYLWISDFLGQYSTETTANALIERFGGDVAFDAVVLAMNKGYSLRQIADAALSNRLETNGDIRDYSGAVESPGGLPGNVIAAYSGKAIKADGQYITLDDLRSFAKEVGGGTIPDELLGTFVLKYTFGLKESGYSFEEIVNGIMFGTIKIGEGRNDGLTYTLVDSDGTYVPPARNKKEGVFHDVSCAGFDFDGDGTPDSCDNDDDNDGVPDSVDCATLDAGVFPGNREICQDGIDQDCDGIADNYPCLCNPTPAYPQQACGATCIAASEECCDASAAGYCPTGYNCFYSPKMCCAEGSVPCGEGSSYCIIPGYENQCIFGAKTRMFSALSAAGYWNALFDIP